MIFTRLISCFLIFNQTTTFLRLRDIHHQISCFLIFNQTTTESYFIPAGRMPYLSVVVWLFKMSEKCQRTFKFTTFRFFLKPKFLLLLDYVFANLLFLLHNLLFFYNKAKHYFELKLLYSI